MRSLSPRTAIALSLCLALIAPAAEAGNAGLAFNGSNVGAIPDNSPTGRTVNFAVSGITAPLSTVSLELGLTHTWMGDLKVTLVSPLGARRLLVFGRTRVQRGSTFGSSADLAGVYRFSDEGRADWWAHVASAATVAPGHFRSTTGGDVLAFHGGCPTHLNVAFAGLSPAEANGQWSLLVTDSGVGDAGTIDSAVLTLEQLAPNVFSSGFEAGETNPTPPVASLGAPVCKRAFADFNGDGLSDFTLVREDGANWRWFLRPNLGAAGVGPETSFVLGGSSDFVLELDYDGDGISDPATWRSGTPGVFRVLPSTRASLIPLEIPLGSTGDEVLQAGDYDGDGRDDFAVLKQPASGAPAGPYTLQIRSSATGQQRSLVVGNGTAFSLFVLGGYDYSGDGIADAAAQGTDPATPAQARFQVWSGTDGTLLQTFNLGTPSSFLIPGNRVGSSIQDITVARSVTGMREQTTRDMATGSTATPITFGLSNDFQLSGDFDGDGLDDPAVWRPSATTGQSKFIIQGSLTPGGPAREVLLGASGDYPIGNARIK